MSSYEKVRKEAFADTRQKDITHLSSLSPVSYMKQWKVSLHCGQLLRVIMATSPQTSVCGLLSQVDVTLRRSAGAVTLWAVQDNACHDEPSGAHIMLTWCITGIAGLETTM